MEVGGVNVLSVTTAQLPLHTRILVLLELILTLKDLLIHLTALLALQVIIANLLV